MKNNMTFTPEETEKLKAMLLFLVKKKHNESQGHGGFQLKELTPILKELEADEEIELHPTINSRMYFLTKTK